MPELDKKIESEVYDEAEVSPFTGETEVYDRKIFPNVIRRREIDLIKSELKFAYPKMILDYGCGGGWLSLRLSRWGFEVVGIDISRGKVKNAKLVCSCSDFIVADAENLPFNDDVFDYVCGISILHHLRNLEQACGELRRVMINGSGFMFMEPNALNPFSAIGRRLFPMEVHTKGEKPFIPTYLKRILKQHRFKVNKCLMLFFLAFPLARSFKITGTSVSQSLVRLTHLFELAMERILLIRRLNSTIVVVGSSNKATCCS